MLLRNKQKNYYACFLLNRLARRHGQDTSDVHTIMKPASTHFTFGREHERALLHDVARSTRNGRGSIVVVTGESGFGKSFLIESVAEGIRSEMQTYAACVECEAPIGKIQVSSLQTLQPFIRGLEALVSANTNAAKKRLVMNIGLSVLGLIPFAGSIFDMTKEVMRDLREYRKEQEKSGGKSSADTVVIELFQSFSSLAAENPFVLFVDDAQWLDPDSVRFLQYLQSIEQPLPFSIVIALEKSVAEKSNTPVLNWLSSVSSERVIALAPFDIDAVRACMRDAFPGRSAFGGLDEWLLRRTSGVPLIVHEYLSYFRSRSPFREDGTPDTEVLASQSIPATLQSLLSKNIESLSEADTNLLSLCSAEGREFSLLLIAQLMNTDILSALRELKSLQFRTGLIRSMGPQARYGSKTTVYEFTQVMHHAYFYARLEHEERVELHDRIAQILKASYDTASDEMLRSQLAPYIAAHALEAGDNETASSMLLATAHTANESGNSAVIDSVRNLVGDLGFDSAASIIQAVGGTLSSESTIDDQSSDVVFARSSLIEKECFDLRQTALEHYFNGDFESCGSILRSFRERKELVLPPHEFALLSCMHARCEIERSNVDVAAELLKSAQECILRAPDPAVQCVIDNIASIVAHRKGNDDESLAKLHEAARSAAIASDDMKLLTVSNIALALEHSDKRKARIFRRMAHQLCSALHYHDFRSAVLEVKTPVS